MKQTNSLNVNYFQNIPEDLKRIIFEYVPSLDYANLSLACRDFYSFLQQNPELWARGVFKEFLGIVPKQNPFFEESCLEQNLALNLSKIQFSKMTDSQKRLVQHHNILKQWKSFFSLFLSPDDCKIFLHEVFLTLSQPNHPPPCLKKDAYYFPTNTLFQNFLTEVYFGVNGRPFIQEKKQILAEQIAKSMNEHLLDRKVDKDRLAALRWYLFNNEKKTKSSPVSNLKASISPKTKIIRKGKVAQKKMSHPETKRSIKVKKIEIPSKVCEIKRSKNDTIVKKDEVEVYQRYTDKNGAGVEEFYWMLDKLIENYCKMVFSYLKSIPDPYLLITEYTRLWNKFALLIIDFSQIFNPFAELFNTLYEDVCKGLPSFPKFSTWRLMVKVWISQVFSNLSYFIGEAFRTILMKVRSQKKSLYMQKPGNTEACSYCDTTQSSDGSNAPYDHFLYKFSRIEREREDIPIEDLIKILQGFYFAVDDISYNEFSIFYWDCTPSDKRSPKGILESLVLQDTQLFYEHSNDCFWQGPRHYKKFMSQDIELVEEIFGKQFGSEIKQLQTSTMKQNLTEILTQAVEEAQDFANSDNQSDDNIQDKKESSLRLDTNLREIFNNLSIDNQTQKEVLENETIKDSVAATLEENSKVIDPYITYLKKEKEEIASQAMEFEETRSHRVLRGFIVAGEKYNKFFELGMTPTLTEVRKVGMEGKDIKEEVEPAEESLVLL